MERMVARGLRFGAMTCVGTFFLAPFPSTSGMILTIESVDFKSSCRNRCVVWTNTVAAFFRRGKERRRAADGGCMAARRFLGFQPPEFRRSKDATLLQHDRQLRTKFQDDGSAIACTVSTRTRDVDDVSGGKRIAKEAFSRPAKTGFLALNSQPLVPLLVLANS